MSCIHVSAKALEHTHTHIPNKNLFKLFNKCLQNYSIDHWPIFRWNISNHPSKLLIIFNGHSHANTFTNAQKQLPAHRHTHTDTHRTRFVLLSMSLHTVNIRKNLSKYILNLYVWRIRLFSTHRFSLHALRWTCACYVISHTENCINTIKPCLWYFAFFGREDGRRHTHTHTRLPQCKTL